MGKIIAIGGGELKDLDTLPIDEEIVRLTGKKRPSALFIPTASKDADGYCETFKQVYGEKLGCKVDFLKVFDDYNTPSQKDIKNKIMSSDLIYVGGGDTSMMLERWKSLGIDEFLKQAYKKGIVLSGLSAGAICWFLYGSSDSQKTEAEPEKLVRINCLGLVNATLSPHHIREQHRDFGLAKIMKTTDGVGIALDDNCAIEIIDGTYRFIRSKENTYAKRIYYKNGKVHSEKLEASDDYRLIDSLFKVQ